MEKKSDAQLVDDFIEITNPEERFTIEDIRNTYPEASNVSSYLQKYKRSGTIRIGKIGARKNVYWKTKDWQRAYRPEEKFVYGEKTTSKLEAEQSEEKETRLAKPDDEWKRKPRMDQPDVDRLDIILSNMPVGKEHATTLADLGELAGINSQRVSNLIRPYTSKGMMKNKVVWIPTKSGMKSINVWWKTETWEPAKRVYGRYHRKPTLKKAVSDKLDQEDSAITSDEQRQLLLRDKLLKDEESPGVLVDGAGIAKAIIRQVIEMHVEIQCKDQKIEAMHQEIDALKQQVEESKRLFTQIVSRRGIRLDHLQAIAPEIKQYLIEVE